MTTKLIDANMGIVLIVERDGKQRKIEFSMTCPSESAKQPYAMLIRLKEFLDEHFERDVAHIIPIAKPRKIKAHRAPSHKQFNKRVKELVP